MRKRLFPLALTLILALGVSGSLAHEAPERSTPENCNPADCKHDANCDPENCPHPDCQEKCEKAKAAEADCQRHCSKEKKQAA